MSEIATRLWPSQDKVLDLFDLGCELGRVLKEEDGKEVVDDDEGVRRTGRLDDLLMDIFDGMKEGVSVK